MEILARLFAIAREQGIIRNIGAPAIKHHCNLYADDVILFMHPAPWEVVAVKELLKVFGEASGLQTNLAKCSITLIYGPQDNLT